MAFKALLDKAEEHLAAEVAESGAFVRVDEERVRMHDEAFALWRCCKKKQSLNVVQNSFFAMSWEVLIDSVHFQRTKRLSYPVRQRILRNTHN